LVPFEKELRNVGGGEEKEKFLNLDPKNLTPEQLNNEKKGLVKNTGGGGKWGKIGKGVRTSATNSLGHPYGWFTSVAIPF